MAQKLKLFCTESVPRIMHLVLGVLILYMMYEAYRYTRVLQGGIKQHIHDGQTKPRIHGGQTKPRIHGGQTKPRIHEDLDRPQSDVDNRSHTHGDNRPHIRGDAILLSQKREGKARHLDDITGTPYLIPDDDVLQSLSDDELMRIYWRYINTIQILCRNQTRLGSFRGGGKEVCLDQNYKPSKPCIVYSFGSNFQFDFDVKAHDYLGCDVYTYDPTKSVKGKTIPKGIRFFETGIAGKDYTDEHNWEMKTMKTILKDNHHENSTIDIIKIDVEGAEWSSIPDMIESGVYRQIKQYLIEVHVGHRSANPKKPYWGNTSIANQLRALRLLYESGFRIFMRDRTIWNMLKLDAPPHDTIATQSEISLINMAFYPTFTST